MNAPTALGLTAPPPPFPPPLAAAFPNLPVLAELGRRPRWVAYQAVRRRSRAGAGEWTSVPLAPLPALPAARRAATDDAATWRTPVGASAWARRAAGAGGGDALRAMPPAGDHDRVCGVHLAPWEADIRFRPGAGTLPFACPAGDPTERCGAGAGC